MVDVGVTSELEVTRKSAAGYYLTDGDGEILLPFKLAGGELSPGDTVSVFVYTDSEDRPVATTQKPLAQVGDFACLKVIDENQHGSFVDWGLDKDLFVPRAEQHDRMIIGRSYVVAVFLDNRTNRVAAASKLGEFFNYDIAALKVDAPVELTVYGMSEHGAQVIVDDNYSGMIHTSELFSKVEVGQKLSGFIAKVREDNKLDIRLRRTGQNAHTDAADIVLEAINAGGGALALGDKSSPDAIKSLLGVSKKAFKAAVGTLYKKGLVIPGPHETRRAHKAES
jgi:predicted RNA-binding protein (virulence factor B family)